jgi:DNA-binding response OmpR family regulator
MKHILLLEDEPEVASLLARVLEDEMYYVTRTATVAEAGTILRHMKVDLLVADILVPDGTAFDILEIVKAKKVPFILMTGSEERKAQLAANGDFHLGKPFKILSFVAEVRDRIGPGNGDGQNVATF